MKFYLDFEATQFSNRIISVGCIADDGSKFYSLVDPGEKEKISPFITELTGITKELIEKAPSTEGVFRSLYWWIYDIMPKGDKPYYFCYGNNDAEFIKASMKQVKDFQVITFMQAMAYSMFDYSESVRKYFSSDQSVALSKLYSFIQKDTVEQKHNALDDAYMLYQVADNLLKFCSPADFKKITNIPGGKKPAAAGSSGRKAPAAFINLQGKMWSSNTGGPTNYQIQCLGSKNKTQYFRDLETAACWIIKYITHESPKKPGVINVRQGGIQKAIIENSTYCGLRWRSKD